MQISECKLNQVSCFRVIEFLFDLGLPHFFLPADIDLTQNKKFSCLIKMQMATFGRRPQGKPPVDIAQEVDARLAAYEPVHLPSFTEAQQQSSGAMVRVLSLSLLFNSQQASQQQRPVRIKTSHVLIFMCLQIGNDPPDYVRIEPCAKLEWTYLGRQRVRAKYSAPSLRLAEALESKYKIIQKDAMYKRFVEVTIDDARAQLASIRRKARDGRVLFH
ncbi:Hypothetical protein, putative [Bodo saltans]|uniref:Raptor N-terminal CASPase-like domain-containing protein n=1 Tax=Bodo saltans TaxID=75058 RepID=A0A0S4JF32_BODSA|nr:Hypothetical protein, putative [Bodo saltans]|eukprot:CUG88723.1 Hypothetical protein, putative [Bodo saltans]